MRFLLRSFSFIPALLMMCAIFSFSAQDGTASSRLSYHFSHSIISAADEALDLELSDRQIDQCIQKIHFYVRKLAHFTEYFLLAVTIAVPLYLNGMRGVRLILATAILCCGTAGSDEMHQYFVEGRSASVRDVLIDCCGALSGIMAVRLIGACCRMALKRRCTAPDL